MNVDTPADGTSLRQRYAAKAMQAILHTTLSVAGPGSRVDADKIATSAFEMADAMLLVEAMSGIEPPAAYGCGGDPLDDDRYEEEVERARAALTPKRKTSP